MRKNFKKSIPKIISGLIIIFIKNHYNKNYYLNKN